MEETVWGDSEHPWCSSGQLLTRGPGTYKIPSFNDVPADMRVKLMDRQNAFAVHSSKVRVLYAPVTVANTSPSMLLHRPSGQSS